MSSVHIEIVEEHQAPVNAAIHRRARRQYHVMLLLGAVATIVVAAALEVRGPRDVAVRWLGFALPPICQFRAWTGHDCPSCGLTRAFASIMRGDLTAAWRFHLAGPAVFAAFAFQIPFRAVQIRRIDRCQDELRWRWVMYALWALVALSLLQWVWRLSLG